MKSLASNRIRMVLLFCITALNIMLFAAGSLSATGDGMKRDCKRCQWVPGGALGVYVDCMGSGWVEQCRPDYNFCWGRRCGEFGGDEEAFDPDNDPPMH